MKLRKTKVSQDAQSMDSAEVVRVHKILGQLEGVEKMMKSSRPWPQVMQQVQAAIAGLTSLKVEILKQHLGECLEEANRTENYSKLVGQVLEVVQMQMRK